MTITPLHDYIVLNHNGSKADFSKTFNESPQLINYWLKSGDRYILENDNTLTLITKNKCLGSVKNG